MSCGNFPRSRGSRTVWGRHSCRAYHHTWVQQELPVTCSLPGTWKRSPFPVVERLLGWFPAGSLVNAACLLRCLPAVTAWGCPLCVSPAAVTLMALTQHWRKENPLLLSCFPPVFAMHCWHNENYVLVGFYCLTNTSRQKRSCLCSCPVHKESLHVCKPLWTAQPSLLRWGWETWFSAFCCCLCGRCGGPSGGSAKEHLNSLDFNDCVSPLR